MISAPLFRRLYLTAAVIASSAAVTLGLFGTTGPVAAKPKRPPGAVKIKPADTKTVGKVFCGKVRGNWLPGTKLAGGFFVSHTQQARNLSKASRKAKGKRRKALKTQSRSFAKKHSSQLKACAGSTPAPTPSPAPTTNPLRFSVSGALGVVLAKSGASLTRRSGARAANSSSNLQAVLPSGQLQNAVSSGSVQVSRVMVGPNNKLYVGLGSMTGGVDLANPSVPPAFGAGCFLAEVDRATGVPTCVDEKGVIPAWSLGFQPTSGAQNPPVQFDGAGNVYYLAGSPGGVTVRRASGGSGVSLTDAQNIQLNDFLVQPDGSVLLSGATRATGAHWFRRVNAGGSLQTLRNAMIVFMKRFPDGNVYFGSTNSALNAGIRRVLTTTGEVEEKYWTAQTSDPYGGGPVDAYFPTNPWCSGPGPIDPSLRGFCGNSGTFNAGFAELPNGTVIAIAGSPQNDTSLMKYFPSVEPVPTALTKISTMTRAGDSVVIAGQDPGGRNVLALNHLGSRPEEILIGASDELEVYHLSYSAGDGRVYFDGLRFSDNRFVFGSIDLGTKSISYNALSSKPEALEMFR